MIIVNDMRDILLRRILKECKIISSFGRIKL